MTESVLISKWRWGRTIEAADLRPDANMLTIIRWVLASAVMFSHAYEFAPYLPGAAADPSRMILPFPVSRLAVLLFFSLSGFLVTGSLIRRGVAEFAIARALRLVPGLWTMLVVTTLILGFAFNSGTFADLLRSSSLHHYIGNNLLLLGRAYDLDGVFVRNRMPTVVNGSLWTIPQEVRCYAALAVVGSLGLLVSRRALTTIFVGSVLVDLLVPADAVAFLTEPRPLAVSFFFGVLLYLWRERVFLSWPLAVAMVGGALMIPAGSVAEIGVGFAGAYAVLVVAILVPNRAKVVSGALPDYSYGIYIYGFPAQQAAAALGLGITPLNNFAMGLSLTLPLAALSWHLVERPALKLKPRLTRSALRHTVDGKLESPLPGPAVATAHSTAPIAPATAVSSSPENDR